MGYIRAGSPCSGHWAAGWPIRCWRLFEWKDCDLQRGSWCGLLQCCCALFRQSTVTDVMDTSGHSSPIWAYRANAHNMRASHDEDRSNPKYMYSLGVVDMDSKLGTDGFHDVLVDNLSTSPSWRSSHISPVDVTALRRRWPKTMFKTMQRRAKEVERLRRGARHRPDRSFQHSAPGFCPICEVKIESALDVHMLNSHLELGQLWHCPVEWCTVWKGSVSDCLTHLNDKHGGSTLFALKNVAKFFPPWTVTRDVWQTALHPDVSGIGVDARLFHEAGCRLVHRYCVYKDPFPHPALRGGGGSASSSAVLRGSGYGHRSTYTARISIPASGAPPGQVPADCFPGGAPSQELTSSRRVSFASDVTVLGDAPPPVHSFCGR